MDTSTTGTAFGGPRVKLPADVTIPARPVGVVLFAHGSGSSRHSPRNRAVAAELNRQGFGTVLVDLLTETEERFDLETRQLRFDIDLLTERVLAMVDQLRAGGEQDPAEEIARLPLGLFGASTGAAAALAAAAQRPDDVPAVVSRGGRPDLAGPALRRVRSATLLLVGELDEEVIRLNEDAREQLAGPAELRIVPGATHLFEEPGALEEVAAQAADWFTRHLADAGVSRRS
ncbi:MAG TPA: dienelactone hydrolase family protein [Micromonospora sp.]